MSHANTRVCSAANELAQQLLAIPPGRRGAMMQSVASFRTHDSLDEAFEAGRFRAAFAQLWEERFKTPVPITALRSSLEPPIPITTLLQFSKLVLPREVQELKPELLALADFLQALIEHHSERSAQLELFERDSGNAVQASDNLAIGHPVSDLSKLIDTGQKFPTVYADPPWSYDNSASRAAAVNHYPTLTVDEICSEPVLQLAAEDAHLHLWTTNAFLQNAFQVIDAWGFQFKSCFVWVKTEIGMGNYWRVSHEFLMLGVRGHLTFKDRTLPSWIEAHRTAHSRKPAIVRSLIERVSPGPYLELYGREELPNSAWTVHGNQVERRMF